MCKNCGNPACSGGDDDIDMEFDGTPPMVLVSKSREPEKLVGLDDAAYGRKLAANTLAAPVLGLLSREFDDPDEAAEACGFDSIDALTDRLTSPDLTIGELAAILQQAGKELAGIAVSDYGDERRRGERRRADAERATSFDDVLTRVLRGKTSRNSKEIS